MTLVCEYECHFFISKIDIFSNLDIFIYMKYNIIKHPKGKRPEIRLTVRRVESNVWNMFKQHHYLTSRINKSCKCLLFEWNNVPVAFAAILNSPRGNCRWAMSISRLVVLPDFQGLGLSTIIFNFCGGIVKALSDDEHDYHLYIKTAHTKLGKALDHNPNARATVMDGKSLGEYAASHDSKYANRVTRRSYCKEYIGSPLYGYEHLLKPIKELREEKLKKLT